MHESHYVSNTRSNVHKHSRFVGKHVCLLIARSRKNRVPGVRAQKIRHVCSISQLLCRVLCNDHAPSPSSRAVIHKSSEIRPRSLLQSIPDRVTSFDYATCDTLAARKYHVLFIPGDNAVNNIRSISRKGKINSTQHPFLSVCPNISLDTA